MGAAINSWAGSIEPVLGRCLCEYRSDTGRSFASCGGRSHCVNYCLFVLSRRDHASFSVGRREGRFGRNRRGVSTLAGNVA